MTDETKATDESNRPENSTREQAQEETVSDLTHTENAEMSTESVKESDHSDSESDHEDSASSEDNEEPTTNAPDGLKAILEAAIFVADEPLSVEQLLSLFHEEEGEILDRKLIRDVLEELAEDYNDKGIELKQVASGYRFQAREKVSKWVNRLWTERPPRYTRALLETLALIAYRQPITRGEIESVRGVSVSSNVLKTLLERDWIKVAGHRDVPGRPAVYATTKGFLDYFNLKTLSELPSLQELRDLDDIAQDLFMNGDPTAKSAEEESTQAQDDAPDQTAGEQLTSEVFENPDQTNTEEGEAPSEEGEKDEAQPDTDSPEEKD